jgi:hypothetical protein
MQMHKPRWIGSLLGATIIIALCFGGIGADTALAASIKIMNIPFCPAVNIMDNGANDTNPAVNIIDFDTSNIPAIAACGITAEGEVTLGGGGALTKLGAGAQIVNLTKLIVLRTVGAGNSITLEYDHVFAAPAAPIMAEDGIVGFFDAVGLFGGSSAPGDRITFQGYVNGAAIMPIKAGDGPGPPFTFNTIGRIVPNEPFMGGHGPQRIAAGGPPWDLSGDVTILLANPGDRLQLPNSAEVGIAGVPEPATWLLLATGLGGVLTFRRRTPVPRKHASAGEHFLASSAESVSN